MSTRTLKMRFKKVGEIHVVVKSLFVTPLPLSIVIKMIFPEK